MRSTRRLGLQQPDHAAATGHHGGTTAATVGTRRSRNCSDAPEAAAQGEPPVRAGRVATAPCSGGQPAASPCTEASVLANAGRICGALDPEQQRLRHKLLVVEIRIHGTRCKALIDSGATHDVLLSCIADKIPVKSVECNMKIQLADGSVTRSGGKLEAVRCYMQNGITFTNDFLIIQSANTSTFQAILGKAWLTAHDPDICWARNTMRLHGELVRGEGERSSRRARVTGVRAMRRAARKRGTRLWLVLVRPAEEEQAKICVTAKEEAARAHLQKQFASLQPPDWAPVEQELKEWPELLGILKKHAAVFEPLPVGLPPPGRPVHRIETEPKGKPPYKRPYRMSPMELDELKLQLQGLLDRGWIRPSHSPYGSPVLFAAKADGSLRMCVDYRALNAITKKSGYPIPRIDEIFDRMGSAKYFTSLDLQMGYHQIGIAPEDVEKTAFVTRYGQFEWLVMPFGLCGAPSTFQSAVNDLLGADVDDFVAAYLDDINVFSGSKREHVEHVDCILSKLEQAGYRCRLSKCKFGRAESIFLGFTVGNGCIKVLPDKVKPLLTWPIPKTPKDVQTFLGLTNFYRRFVQNYADIASCLHALASVKTPWQWTPNHQFAFEYLIHKVTSAPALLLPDWSKPFYVVTDASSVAVGATLLQDHGNGLQPVAFEGRKMSDAERRYITTDQENLALVYALVKWRVYLEGRSFTVETDHNALKHLLTQPQLNRRQARWVEMLSSYDMKIIHKPGKQNRSDPLSRRDYPDEPDGQLLSAAAAAVTTTLGADFLQEVRDACKATKFKVAPLTRAMPKAVLRFDDGLWYIDGRLCIPDNDAIKLRIFKELHDAPTGGHFGAQKTIDSVNRRFFWPELKKDVTEYCKTCPTCQRSKSSNHKPAGLLQPLPVPDHAWQQVTMDFLCNLPKTKTGFNAVMVCVDRFTKQIRVGPCKNTITSQEAARLYLDLVVRVFSLPKTIISDRDPKFTAGFWLELHKLLGTEVKMSTAGHAQTDGQTERANRTLLQILRSYCAANPRNWDELIPMAELAYNAQKQESTGVSPFYANFGREAVLPLDHSLPATKQSVQELVAKIHRCQEGIKEQLAKSQEAQRKYADQRRRDVQYNEGDRVLVDSNIFTLKDKEIFKLVPKYMGPFTITAVPGPVTVKLDLPVQLKTHNVIHVSKLKPFFQTARFGNRGAQPDFELIDGEPEWEVEDILGKKMLYRQPYYLVKWKGYDHCENMWIRRSALTHAMDLVREFDRNNAKR